MDIVERLRSAGTHIATTEHVFEAADEIERNRAAIAELLVALEKCARRAVPHPDDTDADRVRNLYHIEATARAAIAKHNPTIKDK